MAIISIPNTFSAVGVANANMVVMAFKADFVNGITNA